MQHGSDADLGAEMLGVGSDRHHCLGRCLEQDSVDRCLVLIGDIADRRRQREHDVIVRHRQQLGLAVGQPLLGGGTLALGTVPVATGIIGDDGMGAVFAARDVAAERRCAAVLDRRHHLELTEAEVAGIGVAPCRSLAAEDVRHLQLCTPHRRRASGVRPALVFGGFAQQRREAIQRAHDFADRIGRDPRIERRGFQLGMAKQHLDHPHIFSDNQGPPWRP